MDAGLFAASLGRVGRRTASSGRIYVFVWRSVMYLMWTNYVIRLRLSLCVGATLGNEESIEEAVRCTITSIIWIGYFESNV